ncbi:MAG: hypothetical protein C3F14_01805 [Deltaproteobacteria bacterium]|nr:MAG: hypothetical protein C3F14_01805 [Deltaproteobacteria bacterium]
MKTYAELVRSRLEDRHANIMGNLDDFTDGNLRFTVRIFGDCMDEEKRKELLGNYTEYWTESELRDFVKNFLPAYTEYAIAELLEKKKDGERFDPPCLTQEEYQEMAVREKWPKLAAGLEHVTPLQLRREIAKAGLLFRPYMLSDPGFNEGVLEFALYFDLLDRLAKLSPDELRKVAGDIAPMIDRAVSSGSAEACEADLKSIRERAARAAGILADPETFLGPEMERYPREAPPGWKVRELRNTLKTMTLKDLRLSALVHLDLLTTEETRAIVVPFISRFPSFFEIPSNGLREIILAIAEEVSDRAITFFIERYPVGRMAMTPAVSFLVWKLMPEEERLTRLREDNAKMDQAMMSRHLARYLLSGSTADLSDVGKQIALLTDERFTANHGLILKNAGSDQAGEGVRRLYDEVTVLSLRMAFRQGVEKEEMFFRIRERIAEATGIPAPGKLIEGGV